MRARGRAPLALAAALLALGTASVSGWAGVPDKIPPGSAWIGSYADAVAELGRLLNRKAVPSPELAEWMKDNAPSKSFAWPLVPGSYDRALEWFRKSTGLSAKPGTKPDTVEVDFAWHQPQPDVAPADLLAYLASHPPSPRPDLAVFPSVEGEWEREFDALLSTPENFSRAWRVRTTGEQYGFFPFQLHVLYAGPFRDAAGGSHVLLFLNHPCNVLPGAGRASYYLFDARGRLENGGVFDTGGRILNLSASVSADRTKLVTKGWFNGNSDGESEWDRTYRIDASGGFRPDRDGDGRDNALYLTPSPAGGTGAPSR